jgi:c-di-GMP-binding flagellar brake protein YcgR
MKEIIDRRRHERFQLKEHGASVLFKSYPAISGRIIDISNGGLAFDYLAEKRETTDSLVLRLVSTSFDPSSASVSAKTIWDVRIGQKSPVGSAATRRCGVAFEDLTDDQKSDLNRFKEAHTTGKQKVK